jgi:fructose-bisphosphate aldolase class II
LAYIRVIIDKSTAPLGLNLDHGKGLDIIKKGIRSGFPSVMFDGSALPYERNLQATRDVVDFCRPLHVTVEAELGVLNDEGLELEETTRSRLFTDPVRAAEFTEYTGIDSLAVSIGNAHGFYRGKPELDLERLERIKKKVSVPLVLHGGSGLSDTEIQMAISLGIAKINIYTEMSSAASSRLEAIIDQTDRPQDYPSMLLQARDAVHDIVVRKMRVFKSSGKARGAV